MCLSCYISSMTWNCKIGNKLIKINLERHLASSPKTQPQLTKNGSLQKGCSLYIYGLYFFFFLVCFSP